MDCEECHKDAKFLPTAHDACTTCHEDPHRAPFSDDCQSCHQIRPKWQVLRFDHAATGYALVGVHLDVACKGCHPRGVLRAVRHDTCADCHAVTPDGRFAGFPTTESCAGCHAEKGENPAINALVAKYVERMLEWRTS